MCKTPHRIVYPARGVWSAAPWFLLGACCFFSPLSAEAAWQDDIGFTKLEEVLGDDMLTGNGVYISQVEAYTGGDPNKFFPDPNSIHFDATKDPFGVEPTFVNGSPTYPNPKYSNHATNVVANSYYGDRNGVAKGANTIIVYEANDYLENFLNCGGSGGCNTTQPDDPTFIDPSDSQQKQYVIQNHSWAGTFGSTTSGMNADRTVLRKVDYLVDTEELITIVGVRNGDTDPNTSTLPHPTHDNMLSHSYNAVSVGVSDGAHAIDATTLSGYGTGRAKPTIVAPRGTASSAAATVSGSATILYEALDGSNGTRSEPMRAIIYAGATKEQFVDFVDPGTGLVDPWDRSTTEPIDNILGFGELNVFNSYLITEGGEFAGSTSTPTPVGSYGWDYRTVTSANDRLYEFEIPEGSTATELSIALAWNVEVNPSISSQTLANLSLTLRDSTNAIVDQSNSSVDNLEHIYIGANQGVTQLGPGTYTLEVATENFISRDYGLAWRLSTLFDDPSADFDEDGDIDGADFLTWQQNYGTLLGALHGDGDADGDGDVDKADLAIFETDYGPTGLVANLFGVPEPGSLVLAATASAVLLLRWRFSSRCRCGDNIRAN